MPAFFNLSKRGIQLVYLTSISQVPPELASYSNAEGFIDVDLIDKSSEDWKEPPKVLTPFTGEGNKLGG